MEKIKEHYKLYKSGKFLLTAGLMTVTATVSVMGNVHADEAQAVTPDTSLEQAGFLAELFRFDERAGADVYPGAFLYLV